MKIVIDKHIPFIEGVFEPYATVEYVDGKMFSVDMVRDADVLVVRTRTRCDRALLDGSTVSMIATATIGMDHIDSDYCRSAAIKVVSAAGCNARAVRQYIAAVLFMMQDRGCDLQGRTLGVVGVGNVGSQVVSLAKQLGMRVLCCDPFKSGYEYISLDELLTGSDIVTIHTPLTADGEHPTIKMVNDDFFDKMRDESVFINASRGEVVDERALIAAIRSRKLAHTVIDVWNNEPNINSELLDLLDIATPHIAGYSLQGKANATAMSVRAVAEHLGLAKLVDWYPDGVSVVSDREVQTLSADQLKIRIQNSYDIMRDDIALRSDPSGFEKLRNGYIYRIE